MKQTERQLVVRIMGNNKHSGTDMTEKLVTTIRLKKTESSDLRELSWTLTKQQIAAGRMRMITEADIVHMLIEQHAKDVALDADGNLYLKR